MCTKRLSDKLMTIIIYYIDQTIYVEQVKLNKFIEKEMRKIIIPGKGEDKEAANKSMEIVTLTPSPFANFVIRIIVSIYDRGNIKFKGFGLSLSRLKKKHADDNVTLSASLFEEMDYLSNSNKISKNSENFFLGTEFVVLSKNPKFSLFSISKILVIEYDYLDTNNILKLKLSKIVRLVVIIYESLEDGNIYFAVYSLVPFVERQVVRIQHFPEYRSTVEIDFFIISVSIVYIIFYDTRNGELMDCYMFFSNGPFIYSKTGRNIVIDDKRFSLNLYEDKEIHWSYYQTIKKPVLYLLEEDMQDAEETEKVQKQRSFKVNDFYDIKGNFSGIEFVQGKDGQDQFDEKDIKVFRPMNYKFSYTFLTGVNLNDYFKHYLYAENSIYFTMNPFEMDSFEVFRYCYIFVISN